MHRIFVDIAELAGRFLTPRFIAVDSVSQEKQPTPRVIGRNFTFTLLDPSQINMITLPNSLKRGFAVNSGSVLRIGLSLSLNCNSTRAECGGKMRGTPIQLQ